VLDDETVGFEGMRLDDRYVVRGEIGRGGMAVVCLADDLRLSRRVAVKLPRLALFEKRESRDRFEREVRSLTRLDHKSIVKVLDVGKKGEQPFVVMQHLAGGTLADRLRGDSVDRSPQAVLGWLGEVAAALDYTHRNDVIHRDVKPSNILFDDAGDAYLSDYGIARAIGADTTQLTSSGQSPGTPRFMAPEAADDVPVGPAYDQYSLAVVVYHALTGRFPHEADTAVALMTKRRLDPPRPIRELRFDLPESVASVVMRALSMDPTRRFETCGRFAEQFRRASAGVDPSPRSSARALHSRAAAVLAGLVMVGVGGAAWLVSLPGRSAPVDGDSTIAGSPPGTPSPAVKEPAVPPSDAPPSPKEPETPLQSPETPADHETPLERTGNLHVEEDVSLPSAAPKIPTAAETPPPSEPEKDSAPVGTTPSPAAPPSALDRLLAQSREFDPNGTGRDEFLRWREEATSLDANGSQALLTDRIVRALEKRETLGLWPAARWRRAEEGAREIWRHECGLEFVEVRIERKLPSGAAAPEVLLVSRTECTWKAWRSVLKSSRDPNQSDDLPVNEVNGEEIAAFCRDAGFDLPRTGEWRAFAGEDPGGALANYAHFKGSGAEFPRPVKKLMASEHGLFDVLGNVAEMCIDDADMEWDVEIAARRSDASPRLDRPYCGGSVRDEAKDCRPDSASWKPDSGSVWRGFRPVVRVRAAR
jgi:serine/threonine protein kinase